MNFNKLLLIFTFILSAPNSFAAKADLSSLGNLLHCQAMVLLLKADAPLGSIQKLVARGAVGEMQKFRQEQLEQKHGLSENAKPSVYKDLLITNDSDGRADFLALNAQILGIEGIYSNSQENAVQVLGMKRVGRQKVDALFAEIAAFEEKLFESLSANSAEKEKFRVTVNANMDFRDRNVLLKSGDVNNEYTKQRKAFARAMQGDSRPGDWIYHSSAYRLREQTMKALLLSSSQSTISLAAALESNNEVAMRSLGLWDRARVFFQEGRQSYGGLFKSTTLVFDWLVTFDAQNEPTLILVLRVGIEKRTPDRGKSKRVGENEFDWGGGLLPQGAQ